MRHCLQADQNVAPAVEKVPGQGLFPFETLQLTDAVLSKLETSQALQNLPISFGGKPKVGAAQACKAYPGEPGWPSDSVWRLFDLLLGGALIRTTPEAAICYPEWGGNYTASSCTGLTGSWNNSTLRSGFPPNSLSRSDDRADPV